MAVTPVPLITDIPSFPALSDRANGSYNSKAFAFGTHMADKFVDEVNEFAASLNAFAAGGAFAIAYSVDSSIAAGDPGAGKLRFNSVNQGAATALYANLAAAGGGDVTAKLAQFGASTSSVKGTLRLVQLNDLSRELIFNVTALASPAGYRTLTVEPVNGSSVAPFSEGAPVLLYFQRTGDKGEVSSTAFPTLRVQDRKPPGTSGGDAVGGTNARVLNTVLTNTISGASLSANRVTLPAGKYKVTGSVPGYAGVHHQAYLVDFSSGAILVLGTSEQAGAQSPFGQSRSLLMGEISLAATTVLAVNHWTFSGVAGGLGVNSATGQNNVFSELLFEKIG